MLVSHFAYQPRISLRTSLAQAKKAAAEVTKQLKLGKIKEGLTSIAPKARPFVPFKLRVESAVCMRLSPPRLHTGLVQSLALLLMRSDSIALGDQ